MVTSFLQIAKYFLEVVPSVVVIHAMEKTIPQKPIWIKEHPQSREVSKEYGLMVEIRYYVCQLSRNIQSSLCRHLI